jgi:signal transduction histidine kinase
MRPGRWDWVWFAAAVSLLAAGVVGWWQSGPPVSPYPFGAGALMIATWASGAIILFAWWRRSSAPEAFDAPLMGPLALASSASLSLLSVTQISLAPAMAASTVAGLVALPLGWALAGQLVDGAARERARWIASLSAVGAAILGWRIVEGAPDPWGIARWVLTATVALVPAVLLAGAIVRDHDGRQGSAARRMLASLGVLAMGVAPAVTSLCLLVERWPILVLPSVAVVVTLIVLTRFALQPLAGIAGAAQTQRDRVVAAADAERLRLASVLHDGPLADITLLIQRLDDRGDADSAAIARAIATELRAIGSELRLPVLDDLGTGAALEWLVHRLATRSRTSIALDQQTLARPPAAVEFAMYRVAQEALVNALTHGSPPIRVGYRATSEAAELRVEDSGPGIPADAITRAERDGRLGMASMAQRAEAIGARVIVAARPQGGTRVELTWRAPTPMPGLVDAAPVSPTAAGVARARP